MKHHQKNKAVNNKKSTHRKKPKSLSFAPISAELENDINDQHAPNYLALYGLRESAFSQEADDSFFFLGDEQVKYLSLLHNLIQDQNLVLHVKGASGVGKTSLLNRFINSGEEDWRFSFFTANAMMNIEQLFYNISAGFGLSGIAKNSKDLKKNCIKNIALLESSGVVPVLIIDDVHELPIESLKSIYLMLSGWGKKHPKLRVVLISNPQFDKILESNELKNLKQIISHVMEIKPLQAEQIERYIYFRLTKAGLDGGNPIASRSCEIISEKSKGLPREINSLCHLALRDGIDEMTMKEFFDDHNFNFPYRKYLITGAFIAIFFSILFSYIEPFGAGQNQLLILNSESTAPRLEPNTALSPSSILGHLSDEIIEPLQQSNNSKIELVNPSIISNDDVKYYDFTQIKLNLTNELVRANSNVIFNLIKSEYEKRNKVNASDKTKFKSNAKNNNNVSTLTIREKITPPEILFLKPATIVATKSKLVVRLYGKKFTKNSKLNIITKSGSKNTNVFKFKYISNTQLNLEINPSVYLGRNWITISDSIYGQSNKLLLEVKPIPASNSTVILENKMEDIQWILAQKSDSFILQILGSKQKNELVKFIYKKKVKGQYAIFETNRNGIKWYHLILGPYKDKSAAKLAVQNLPRQVNTPWIRPIKDIQKLIRRVNKQTL